MLSVQIQTTSLRAYLDCRPCVVHCETLFPIILMYLPYFGSGSVSYHLTPEHCTAFICQHYIGWPKNHFVVFVATQLRVTICTGPPRFAWNVGNSSEGLSSPGPPPHWPVSVAHQVTIVTLTNAGQILIYHIMFLSGTKFWVTDYCLNCYSQN